MLNIKELDILECKLRKLLEIISIGLAICYKTSNNGINSENILGFLSDRNTKIIFNVYQSEG